MRKLSKVYSKKLSKGEWLARNPQFTAQSWAAQPWARTWGLSSFQMLSNLISVSRDCDTVSEIKRGSDISNNSLNHTSNRWHGSTSKERPLLSTWLDQITTGGRRMGWLFSSPDHKQLVPGTIPNIVLSTKLLIEYRNIWKETVTNEPSNSQRSTCHLLCAILKAMDIFEKKLPLLLWKCTWVLSQAEFLVV